MRLFPAVATAFLCLLLICAGPASSAEPALSFALASDSMSWSIVSGAGVRQQTLLKDARVRLWLTDGSEVVWKEASQDTDGRSMTFVSDQLTLKIVIVYAPNGRPPNTVTLLPLVFSKGSGVSLRDLRMADGAQVLGFGPDSRVFVEGDQGRSPAEIRPLPAQGRVRSWWHTILTRTGNRTFLAGFISNVVGQNTFDMVRNGQNTDITITSGFRSLRVPALQDGYPLDALYLSWGSDPDIMLAQYAAGTRVFTEVMDPAPGFAPWATPTGWSSARDSGTSVSLADILSAVHAGSNGVFKGSGIRVIQLENGYQTNFGDWDINGKFPQGHKSLVRDTIHKGGYKAALWLAPFVVSPQSRVAREHPEYLLKGVDGKAHAMNSATLGGSYYCLDISLPEVRDWLKSLFRKISVEWGYDFVKIDYLSLPLESWGAMRGSDTPVQAYREALKSIREGCGPNTYILGIGAPIGPSIGLFNGMRIGSDVSTSWEAVSKAAMNTATRRFTNNTWWQNDPDALVARSPLSLNQARAWATVTAFSGGSLMLGDNAGSLDSERIALVSRALPVAANGSAPAFGSKPPRKISATGARTRDLWQIPALPDTNGITPQQPPRIWFISRAGNPAGVDLAALFNWSSESRTGAMSLGSASSRFHVFDLWDFRYLGTMSKTVKVPQSPTSVRLLALAPDAGRPQFLGSDAHIVCGLRDIKRISWSSAQKTLSGQSFVTPGRSYRIAVSVPAGWAVTKVQVNGAVVNDKTVSKGYLVIKMAPKSYTVRWSITYKRV
jgi:hypothetical protein